MKTKIKLFFRKGCSYFVLTPSLGFEWNMYGNKKFPIEIKCFLFRFCFGIIIYEQD